MNLKVLSFQVADSIDIKQFKTAFTANIEFADSDELFKDLLQYRTSVVLEWVIIILILVEVSNIFLEKIFK